MKSKKRRDKLTTYITILNLLREGLLPINISKQLNLKRQSLTPYLNKLKELGYIKRTGYGVWDVSQKTLNTLDLDTSKSIRGHAFIWSVKIPKELRKIIKERATERVDCKLTKSNVLRLFIKNHKVWIGTKNIVVYENKSFYAKNSINSRKYAVIKLLEVLHALESKLGVNLSPYVFKASREHYGMIRNDLARQYNRSNEKLIVHDDLEGDWLWIDDSESLGELETGGKKAIVRSKQVQDWWNNQKEHNFKVTPDFVLNGFNQLTINQREQAKQIGEFAIALNKHIPAYEGMAKAVETLIPLIKSLKKENEQLKQRRLKEFGL